MLSGTQLATTAVTMKRHLRICLVIATLCASSACVVRGHAVYTVDTAPPPPRATIVVQPRAGYVWIEGNWQYERGRWVWHEGYWVRERAGQIWVPGAWIQVGARWHWREGRWQHHDHRTPAPRPRAIDHRNPPPPRHPPVVPR